MHGMVLDTGQGPWMWAAIKLLLKVPEKTMLLNAMVLVLPLPNVRVNEAVAQEATKAGGGSWAAVAVYVNELGAALFSCNTLRGTVDLNAWAGPVVGVLEEQVVRL